MSTRRVCSQCGTPIDLSQRYCIACGERLVELPARVRVLLGPRDPEPAVAPSADPAPAPAGFRLPRPRDMAVAVLAVLGFGVVVGAAVSPAARPATPPYYVALTPAPPPAPAPAPVDASDTAGDDDATAVAPAPVVAPAPAPAPAPPPARPAAKPPKAPPAPPPPSAPALPPIKHVFLIVLSDQGFEQAFGPTSTSTYLARTLAGEGELVTNYYAVASGHLANANALISGQGPTLATTLNCPSYADIAPGTAGADGQVLGDGCIYPSSTQTIADALVAGGHSWKAYVQGMGTGADGRPATCRTPPPTDTPPVDPATGAATAPDPYAPWRNPFVYFHSILDTPLCAQNDVGLEQLTADLQTTATTPSFSYIVPDLCHNGSDTPCAPGQPAGLAQSDAFLRQVVPQIMASEAYRDGGMIAITFDQAPQTGEHADSSSCCETPAYPNLAAPPAPAPPAAEPVPTEPVPTEPVPTEPVPTEPAPTEPAPAEPTATASADPAATTPVDAVATPAPAPTPTTPTPVDPGLPTRPTGGGGHVGLLLLSPYVEPATTSAFNSYNHFSLLKSIEALFGVEELGYTSAPTLPAFDATVYTNPTGEPAAASPAG